MATEDIGSWLLLTVLPLKTLVLALCMSYKLLFACSTCAKIQTKYGQPVVLKNDSTKENKQDLSLKK